MIGFRCHAFFWRFMWWCWRVTCCPMGKYFWRRYWRRQFFFTNIGWIFDWYNWVGNIRINVNQVIMFVIPNCRFFAHYFSTSKLFLCSSFSRKFAASKVFTFNFFCAMPQCTPVVKIRHSSDRSENVVDDFTVRFWDYGSNESLWFHPSAVTNIPLGSSTSNISTTLQPPKGGVVTINVYIYGCLFGVENCWLNNWVILTCYVIPEVMRYSYRVIFRPTSFDQQRYLGKFFRK